MLIGLKNIMNDLIDKKNKAEEIDFISLIKFFYKNKFIIFIPSLLIFFVTFYFYYKEDFNTIYNVKLSTDNKLDYRSSKSIILDSFDRSFIPLEFIIDYKVDPQSSAMISEIHKIDTIDNIDLKTIFAYENFIKIYQNNLLIYNFQQFKSNYKGFLNNNYDLNILDYDENQSVINFIFTFKGAHLGSDSINKIIYDFHKEIYDKSIFELQNIYKNYLEHLKIQRDEVITFNKMRKIDKFNDIFNQDVINNSFIDFKNQTNIINNAIINFRNQTDAIKSLDNFIDHHNIFSLEKPFYIKDIEIYSLIKKPFKLEFLFINPVIGIFLSLLILLIFSSLKQIRN